MGEAAIAEASGNKVFFTSSQIIRQWLA